VQHFVRIAQTVLKISIFFDFQDGRCLPSWIFKFLVAVGLKGLVYIIMAKFMKIIQTVAEISRLTVFKMAAAILDYFKFKFLNSWQALKD